jgi:hypothetical protein
MPYLVTFVIYPHVNAVQEIVCCVNQEFARMLKFLLILNFKCSLKYLNIILDVDLESFGIIQQKIVVSWIDILFYKI